jgi:hypothetical protein
MAGCDVEDPPGRWRLIGASRRPVDRRRAEGHFSLAHGATDNGLRGLRPEYEDGYFAAFVLDPNGHNLEAVFKDALRAS